MAADTVQAGDGVRFTEAPLSPHKRILPVEELLTFDNLRLPPYQRPYKWTPEHVRQLISDVRQATEPKTDPGQQKEEALGACTYRLGTVVLHRSAEGSLDIVDGQQRILTLLLVVKAMMQVIDEGESGELRARERLERLLEETSLYDALRFSNRTSVRNLRTNFHASLQALRTAGNLEALTSFLLDRCEVVCFVLENVSEAFQFFDSQNARGKDLDPHDLLKAFHLREFHQARNGNDTEEMLHGRMGEAVRVWEAQDSSELARLFGEYLYRIRHWLRGRRPLDFTKSEIHTFKGIPYEYVAPGSPASVARYPYLQLVQTWLHNEAKSSEGVADDEPNRRGEKGEAGAADNLRDHEITEFPFKLDMKVVNGPPFFRMVDHYLRLLNRLEAMATHYAEGKEEVEGEGSDELREVLDKWEDPMARDILEAIGTYSHRYRTGDSYVRMLFNSLLVFYVDKFGTTQLGRAVEVAFFWAYRLRLTHRSVFLRSVDKYVVDDDSNNAFRHLSEAISPTEFFARIQPLPVSVESTNTTALEDLFERRRLIVAETK